tara:strand:+ start:674 stop:1858 length:1185 start_codon:yes stop_codon:yes gene_type:complete
MNDSPEPTAPAATTTSDQIQPRLRRRLTATVLGTCAALLIAEAALWSLDLPRFDEPHTFPSQFMLVGAPDADGGVRHVNKPNAEIQFRYSSDPRGYFGPDRVVTHNTNSLGFRGPEFPLRVTAAESIAPTDRESTAVRIVFLGDSVTFGEGVHDQDTFVERIGRRLQSELGQPIEVYNFGVGGHNSSDANWTWERYARHIDPDLVVYTFVLNDAEPGLFQVAPGTGEPVRVARRIEARHQKLTSPPTAWWFRSRLALWGFQAWATSQLEQSTLEYYRELNASYSPSFGRCLDDLRSLQQMDPPLVVAIFPLLHDLASHPFRPVHLEVAAACDECDVIDLWEPLAARAGHNTTDLWVHPTDMHPNEIAHAVAAVEIAKRLAVQLRARPTAPFSAR